MFDWILLITHSRVEDLVNFFPNLLDKAASVKEDTREQTSFISYGQQFFQSLIQPNPHKNEPYCRKLP